MVSFLEICRRAATGPIVAPDDFDMQRLVPDLKKAIAQHGLKPLRPCCPLPAMAKHGELIQDYERKG